MQVSEGVVGVSSAGGCRPQLIIPPNLFCGKRFPKMQQYGISVSIFEQGNLQGNSSGPSDPPGLVVCLFFLFPPGAFRQLALSLYIEFLTHQSYRASVLTPVLHKIPVKILTPWREFNDAVQTQNPAALGYLV